MHTHAHTHTHSLSHMHTHMYTHACTWIHTENHVHQPIHTHTDTHTHTHTHTQAWINSTQSSHIVCCCFSVPAPPPPPRGVEYYRQHSEYSDKHDINANHHGNHSSFIATTPKQQHLHSNASFIATTHNQGKKQQHSRHSNYVATQIGGNYVQYDNAEKKKHQGRPIPVATSNYALKKAEQKQGSHGYHVGRSGSVPVGISNLLTSPTGVAKQQQYVPSHSSFHVATSNHSIASVAGIDPYSNQSSYSLCSIATSPQYIGASNSVIHAAPSNHSLTTIAHASDYTGLPVAPPTSFGLPIATATTSSKTHPLSLATGNSKSQSELRNSASTPSSAHPRAHAQAPPVPPKPKRHSDGADLDLDRNLDDRKKVTNGRLPHSQSYSEALMLRKPAAQPPPGLTPMGGGGSNPGSALPHTTDSVSVTDYRDYMPPEGVMLLPVSSGTSLIVHGSGPEGLAMFLF